VRSETAEHNVVIHAEAAELCVDVRDISIEYQSCFLTGRMNYVPVIWLADLSQPM